MISALEAADCAGVARLSRQAFAHAPGQQWTEDALASVIENPHHIALVVKDGVVKDGGALHGYALVRLAGPEAELLSVAVDAAMQGRGLGVQLLDTAIAHAALAGAEEMLLEVAADNAPAAVLYEKMGFARVGQRAKYYKSVSNQWVDAIVMRRALI